MKLSCVFAPCASAVVILLLAGAAAAPDTAWDELHVPHPRATYGSFAAACAKGRTLINSALGLGADATGWTRDSVAFGYWEVLRLDRGAGGIHPVLAHGGDRHVPAVQLEYESHSNDSPGAADLERALAAAGWARNESYTADGDDGGTFAFECAEALVFVDERRDGGDDSDTTYVPTPGATLHVTIVPRPPLDPRIPPRWR